MRTTALWRTRFETHVSTSAVLRSVAKWLIARGFVEENRLVDGDEVGIVLTPAELLLQPVLSRPVVTLTSVRDGGGDFVFTIVVTSPWILGIRLPRGGLEMRLQYWTLLVLGYLSEFPAVEVDTAILE